MNFFWKLGLESPLWSAGQFIAAHYKDQLPPPPAPPEEDPFADDRKLRVIIAARPKRSTARLFVNQEQVCVVLLLLLLCVCVCVLALLPPPVSHSLLLSMWENNLTNDGARAGVELVHQV